MGEFPRGRENWIVGKLEKLAENTDEFRGTGL